MKAALLALGALLVAVAAGYAVHRWDAGTIALAHKALSDERAAAAQASDTANTKYRALEARMQKGADDARDQYATAQAAAQTAAAGAAAELDRLRAQLARAGARGGDAAPAADASAGADGAVDNAAVLRFVVGDCAARYAGMAGEADRLRAQVMGLQGYVSAVTGSALLAPQK